MKKLRCHSCLKDLPAGSLKYVLEIKSFADFDGYLEEYEGNIEDGIDCLLDAMDEMDEKAIEQDVAREMIFILCKSCCDKFMNDPFQNERTVYASDDVKGTLH
ncbi:hypothetical protein EPN18_10370 [bacterium]|nr:MAG: hypothetical protein EPN18_10370 [bacterium]